MATATLPDSRPTALARFGTPRGHLVLRARSWSVLVPVRPTLVAAGLVAVALVCAGVALAHGSASLDPIEALRAALGDGDRRSLLLVREVRMPRVQAGLAVGAALGLSGCLLQTVARNRLATPGIVGIDNGATAFAVGSVVEVSTSLLPSAAALAGAASTAVVVALLAGGTGSRGYRFIVCGIGVGALLGAVTNVMLARAPIDQARAAYPWTIGSLNGRDDTSIAALSLALVVLLPVGALAGRHLRALRFSEATARSIGTRVGVVRVGVIAVAVVAAGLAVAVGGPLGMVALVGPEAARRLAGTSTVPVVSATAAGAVLVVLADLAGRTLFSPIEIPVGLVTAVLGAPYLLWAVLRGPVAT